jgi:hypothetical protein
LLVEWLFDQAARMFVLVVVAALAQASECEVDGRVESVTLRLANGQAFASVWAQSVMRSRFTNAPLAGAEVRGEGVVVHGWVSREEVRVQADVGLEFRPYLASAGSALTLVSVSEGDVQLVPAPRLELDPVEAFVPQAARCAVVHYLRQKPHPTSVSGDVLEAPANVSASPGGPALVKLYARVHVVTQPGRWPRLQAQLDDGARIDGWATRPVRLASTISGTFSATTSCRVARPPSVGCSVDLLLLARADDGPQHEVGVIAAGTPFQLEDVQGELLLISLEDGPISAAEPWNLAIRAKDLVHCEASTEPLTPRRRRTP